MSEPTTSTPYTRRRRGERPVTSRFRSEAQGSHDTDGHPEVWCVGLDSPKSAQARLEAYLQFRHAAAGMIGPPRGPAAYHQAVDDERANPACFLLRHAIELALKFGAGGQRAAGHGLVGLLNTVATALRQLEPSQELAPEFVDLVLDFDQVDSNGEVFRYASEGRSGTCCVDPGRLRVDIATLDEAVMQMHGVAPGWAEPEPPSFACSSCGETLEGNPWLCAACANGQQVAPAGPTGSPESGRRLARDGR